MFQLWWSLGHLPSGSQGSGARIANDRAVHAGVPFLGHVPDPDLFIRTGGEMRVSNFLLWQMAYSEFYFSDVLWPDFDARELDVALLAYQQRERRFGRTSEQVSAEPHNSDEE